MSRDTRVATMMGLSVQAVVVFMVSDRESTYRALIAPTRWIRVGSSSGTRCVCYFVYGWAGGSGH